MKNIAVNTLKYSGIVTLSQNIGKNKIKIAQLHNTGGSSLFNFLAMCLAGDLKLASEHVPDKIKFLRRIGTKEAGYVYQQIKFAIGLRVAPEQINTATESRVRFSFIVPRDHLESLDVSSDNTVLGIGLYSKSTPMSDDNAKNFMAFCALEGLDPASVFVNSTLTVDWDLVISNVSSTET